MDHFITLSYERYEELLSKSIALDAIFTQKEAYEMGKVAELLADVVNKKHEEIEEDF